MCLFKVINKKRFVYLVHLFSIYIVTNHDRKENKCGGRKTSVFSIKKSWFVQTLFP